MPYISQRRREAINVELMEQGAEWAPDDAGDLNFLVSTFIHNHLKYVCGGVRYAYLNDMIGALECCKLELYREFAAPYEDEKKAENGAVYEFKPKDRGNY